MNYRMFTLSTLTSLGLILGTVEVYASPGSHTQEAMSFPSAESMGHFRRLDQPLWSKVVVTATGLSLIGLELWWFLLSKSPSKSSSNGSKGEV